MCVARFNLIKTNPFRFTNNEVEFPSHLEGGIWESKYLNTGFYRLSTGGAQL